MVCGNIKPGRLAIHEEHVLFGRFIFLAHFARASEVSFPSLCPNQLTAFRIPLEKRNFQPRCASIFLFEPSLNRSHSRVALGFLRICGVLVTPKQPEGKKDEAAQFELKSCSQAHKYTNGGTPSYMTRLRSSQVSFFHAAGARTLPCGRPLPTGPEVPRPGVTYLTTPEAAEQKATIPVVSTVVGVALTSPLNAVPPRLVPPAAKVQPLLLRAPRF